MTIPRLHARAAAERAVGCSGREIGLVVFCLEGTMMERSDPHFDAVTARLLHREALRRAANELNTTSVPGLESVLARISAEVTAEAAGLLSLPSQRGRDGVIIQLKRVTPSNAHS